MDDLLKQAYAALQERLVEAEGTRAMIIKDAIEILRKIKTNAQSFNGKQFIIAGKPYAPSQLAQAGIDGIGLSTVAELIGELRQEPVLKPGEELRILTGKDIERAYGEAYLGSCMHPSRGHAGAKYLKVYAQAPVQMLAVYRQNELIARGLLWDAVTETGAFTRYLDRLYGCSKVDRIGRLLRNVAQHGGAEHEYVRHPTGPTPLGLYTIVPNLRGMPYIDSFASPVIVSDQVLLKLEHGPLRNLHGGDAGRYGQRLSIGSLSEGLIEQALPQLKAPEQRHATTRLQAAAKHVNTGGNANNIPTTGKTLRDILQEFQQSGNAKELQKVQKQYAHLISFGNP